MVVLMCVPCKYQFIQMLKHVYQTKKVGNVQGFMKDLEIDVDMQAGLQPVKMKVLYI